jgi:23S rRNA pseudouridine1911/1915/1917 synthase
VRSGRVLLNGRRVRPAEVVRTGDLIEYELPEVEFVEARPEAIPLSVVYDEADLVVVDKPAGMVVHPSAGHYSGTLVHALLGLGGAWSTIGGAARPGIVHRLDKGTSGLILAARTDLAHRSLAAQLADRTMSRTYLAVVRGGLAVEQVVEGAIGRHPRDRLRMAIVEGGRPARTRIKPVERRGGHTLVECDLETGRTHQIRVHLAALGHPVAGDGVYGQRQPGDPARPMLHAHRLRFRHPRSGAAMNFETPPPEDFVAFWEALR